MGHIPEGVGTAAPLATALTVAVAEGPVRPLGGDVRPERLPPHTPAFAASGNVLYVLILRACHALSAVMHRLCMVNLRGTGKP
jgi:hypothetical protein